MIQLVLDTSIFRQDRKRFSPAFKALTRLLQAERVTLHLPEWVKREVISQLQEDAQAKLAALSGAAKVLKDVSYVPELGEFAKELQDRITELNQTVCTRHAESFEGWLSSCKVVEHPANPNHVTHLIDAYFGGHPPFSKAKSRQDIPDALIWQSVLDILRENQPLHLVVADKRFKSCTETVNGICAYESLPEFIQSQPCQDALREEHFSENCLRALRLLAEDPDALTDEVRKHIEMQIRDYQFRDEEVPTSDQAARILSGTPESDLNIQFDDFDYYGAGEAQMPFMAPYQCRIQYTIPVSLYEALPRGRMDGVDIIQLDPFTYLAEENVLANVVGVVTMTFDTELFSDPNLPELELRNEIGRAKVSTEVQDVGIIDLA